MEKVKRKKKLVTVAWEVEILGCANRTMIQEVDVENLDSHNIFDDFKEIDKEKKKLKNKLEKKDSQDENLEKYDEYNNPPEDKWDEYSEYDYDESHYWQKDFSGLP